VDRGAVRARAAALDSGIDLARSDRDRADHAFAGVVRPGESRPASRVDSAEAALRQPGTVAVLTSDVNDMTGPCGSEVRMIGL
jgi:hypothetical protein